MYFGGPSYSRCRYRAYKALVVHPQGIVQLEGGRGVECARTCLNGLVVSFRPCDI